MTTVRHYPSASTVHIAICGASSLVAGHAMTCERVMVTCPACQAQIDAGYRCVWEPDVSEARRQGALKRWERERRKRVVPDAGERPARGGHNHPATG